MGEIKNSSSGSRRWLCCANLMLFMIVLSCLGGAQRSYARTITDSSALDNLLIRPLFHAMRNFTFAIVGPTSLLKRTGKFYQSPLRRFPCDTSFGRSPEPPTSVHKLRPGKCGVIIQWVNGGDFLIFHRFAKKSSVVDSKG